MAQKSRLEYSNLMNKMFQVCVHREARNIGKIGIFMQMIDLESALDIDSGWS